MMGDDIDFGGPAFPVHEQWTEWSELKADYMPKTGPRGGMTLRDYFAARSMEATITKCDLVSPGGHHGADTISEKSLTNRYACIARSAYEMADAMLKERIK